MKRLEQSHNRPRVVVLGAGYAGLAFVRAMAKRRRDVELVLVDRNPYHTLLTETHTVAAGSRPVHAVEVPLSVVDRSVRVVRTAVTGIEPDRKRVLTGAGPLTYDHLVFALGGDTNDFGIPGVTEYALFLRSLQDAVTIHQRFAALTPGDGVVIVGGGLTGVELAAELALHHRSARRQITLVEATNSLLPGLPESLQERARRRLGWLGVNVLTGAPVTTIDQRLVHLRTGAALPHGLVVWCAGVKGHSLTRQLGVELDRNDRAFVDDHLRAGPPGIYVLGDSARWGNPPLPPSAQLAEQMGLAAAADLCDRLSGGPGLPFRPQLRGVLCDLGGLNATGLVFRLQVAGLLGGVAKRVSVYGHLLRSMGFRSFLRYNWGRLRRAWRQS